MQTYNQHGEERLISLCKAIRLESKIREITETFRMMTAPWGDSPVGSRKAPWVSDVADDHTPYEFSVVFGKRPELRLLVEAQAEPPSLHSNWEMGLSLTRSLAERFHLDLSRYERCAPLFVPRNQQGKLGMWHAVSFRTDEQQPDVKVYFDAQARGRYQALALVEQALDRLGLSAGWPSVAPAGQRGQDLDELKYFSLDLATSADARVKLYWRLKDANASHVAKVIGELGQSLSKEEVRDFCSTMVGHDGPYRNRPIFLCTSLTKAAPAVSSTLYVPVAAYATSDAQAGERIDGFLSSRRLGEGQCTEVTKAVAKQPLDAGAGLVSYVSLQRRQGEARVTAYFSPQAHHAEPARTSIVPPQRAMVEPAERIVEKYEHDVLLADHPFFQRLGREAVNLSHLWLIVANFWEGVVHDFPARLSRSVARMDDDRLRCLFVKQLNDELGEGDFTRAHKAMYRRFVDALEPYRMQGDYAALTAPGREFSRALGEQLFENDPHQAIGALMMIEIYGKQADMRLGDEFRRQETLDTRALEWLHLHENLEVDHADDSLTVARLMPRPESGPEARLALEAVWRGADAVVAAGHAYFNGLYRIAFGS